MSYEFRVFFCGDAPVVVFVRSKFVFFKALRIASRLTGVSRTIFAFSSRSRMVHLECPSGTGPQASSMIRASARPSTYVSSSSLTGTIIQSLYYGRCIPSRTNNSSVVSSSIPSYISAAFALLNAIFKILPNPINE